MTDPKADQPSAMNPVVPAIDPVAFMNPDPKADKELEIPKDVENNETYDGSTNTWLPAIPEPFWTTKGLPFWKRLNEKNWRPQCLYCKTAPIFKDRQEYEDHYKAQHTVMNNVTRQTDTNTSAGGQDVSDPGSG